MLKRKEFILEVSTSPIENVKAFRLIAESNNWPITTHEGSRLVDRFAIIIPMAQSARTLGLELMEGPLQGLEMHSWAETKGSAGAINMTAWTIPGGQGNEEAMDLIENGLNLFLAVHGNGRLESVVESATSYPFSGAHARLLLSWD